MRPAEIRIHDITTPTHSSNATLGYIIVGVLCVLTRLHCMVPLVVEQFLVLDVHPEVILRRLFVKVRLSMGEKEEVRK